MFKIGCYIVNFSTANSSELIFNSNIFNFLILGPISLVTNNSIFTKFEKKKFFSNSKLIQNTRIFGEHIF